MGSNKAALVGASGKEGSDKELLHKISTTFWGIHIGDVKDSFDLFNYEHFILDFFKCLECVINAIQYKKESMTSDGGDVFAHFVRKLDQLEGSGKITISFAQKLQERIVELFSNNDFWARVREINSNSFPEALVDYIRQKINKAKSCMNETGSSDPSCPGSIDMLIKILEAKNEGLIKALLDEETILTILSFVSSPRSSIFEQVISSNFTSPRYRFGSTPKAKIAKILMMDSSFWQALQDWRIEAKNAGTSVLEIDKVILNLANAWTDLEGFISSDPGFEKYSKDEFEGFKSAVIGNKALLRLIAEVRGDHNNDATSRLLEAIDSLHYLMKQEEH